MAQRKDSSSFHCVVHQLGGSYVTYLAPIPSLLSLWYLTPLKKDRNFTFYSFDLCCRCGGNISTAHLRFQELQEHMFLSVILWLKSVHVWHGNCDFLLKYKQNSLNVQICFKFHQKVARITMMQLFVCAGVSVICWFRRNQPGMRERALAKYIVSRSKTGNRLR